MYPRTTGTGGDNSVAAGAAPRCNLPVAVARLSANVPAGGAYNNDRIIPEEGFVIKEKLAIWSKKQMFFSKASEKEKEFPIPRTMQSELNWLQ